MLMIIPLAMVAQPAPGECRHKQVSNPSKRVTHVLPVCVMLPTWGRGNRTIIMQVKRRLSLELAVGGIALAGQLFEWQLPGEISLVIDGGSVNNASDRLKGYP